jgi:outer membrane protein assembly factor BamE (lipoprotein component of BamABCDE complex)
MRSISCLLIWIVLAGGCVSANHLMTHRKLDQLTAGMNEEKVLGIAGTPDKRYEFDQERFVFYYQTKGPAGSSDDLAGSYTAVSFEEGRVITIGQDLREVWELEAADARGKPDSELSETERRAKIKALEEEVRPIPISNAEQNLKIYEELLSLDPDNPHYRRKVDFYRQRLQQ